MNQIDLQSLGNAAAVYQRDPRELEKTLRRQGAKPQLWLDGVPYYATDQMVAAMQRLSGRDPEAR